MRFSKKVSRSFGRSFRYVYVDHRDDDVSEDEFSVRLILDKLISVQRLELHLIADRAWVRCSLAKHALELEPASEALSALVVSCVAEFQAAMLTLESYQRGESRMVAKELN